jgi:regulator of sirC expression with transglutaminase-like and TPR domain
MPSAEIVDGCRPVGRYGGASVADEDPTVRFAELVQGPDDELPLDEASLLIAAHAYPDLDVGFELEMLDGLAEGCPDRTLEGWRRYLFVDQGFTGNVENYYDPDNSFLNQVLRRRVGLPIALSVLGMEVGRRLGLHLAGVGLPGHFLLRDDADPPTFVDPFAGGRVLDREGCIQRFKAVNGASAPFVDSFLDPVSTRSILGRMLANLRAIYAARGDLDSLAWVFALRLAIPGTPAIERRELARVLGSTGQFVEAAEVLEGLAVVLPTLEQDLLTEALALRARLN